MYLPGQIVYDLDKKCPVQIGGNVWNKASYPTRSTHFIQKTPMRSIDDPRFDEYEIAHPDTLDAAQQLLDRGLISPAPCPPSHCWKCRNWKTNCARFKTCSEWGTSYDAIALENADGA